MAIAVLQRLFSICISNLEEVVNNTISFSDQGLRLFSVSKALSDHVCSCFCIYITVSVSLLPFYTFLHKPIGAQRALTQRLDFSPVSEVCFSQSPSSVRSLSFASSAQGLNQGKWRSRIAKVSSERFFLVA